MAKKQKFEWKPSWTEIKERIVPPSKCQPGQYRRDQVSKAKGVDAIYCCPKGTVFDPKKRGCFKGGKRKARPILQALRHKVDKFKKRYPVVWTKLQKKKTTKGGVRKVTV
jgi:hypothetical protein